MAKFDIDGTKLVSVNYTQSIFEKITDFVTGEYAQQVQGFEVLTEEK